MSTFSSYRAELHVHTVLSPCAEIEMIPPLIIQEAVDLGINILGITDHNATANIEAVVKAANGTGVTILPGMELQTVEEIHVLCLFDSLDQISHFQNQVNKTMPGLANRPDFFGEQFVVDSTGEFIRREDSLLLTSSSLTIRRALELVNSLNGLLIPAHVNRKAFGLFPTLGLIPDELEMNPVFEISRHLTPEKAYSEFPQLITHKLIQSGDVHRLDDFLGINQFILEKPSITEIIKAFNGLDGRKFEIRHSNL